MIIITSNAIIFREGKEMAHAEKCPVCGGTGKILKDEYPFTTAINNPTTCHGCGGLGWVTVQDGAPLKWEPRMQS